MYIQSFHIDGFGIFADVQVDNLPPGLTVFLGENEAGKSTCLEFLRTMLVGYPHARSREARRIPPPLRGGQPGGSLHLVSEEQGDIHLTRRPGQDGGVLTLCNADGAPLESSLLQQLLFGINRDVYRNVFGFSLTELQTFESLSGDGVRNALYGASFGAGLRSPVEALRELDSRKDALFRSSASKPRLNEELTALEKLRGEIQAVSEESAGYDQLATSLNEKKQTLAALRERRAVVDDERRRVERRLNVWQQWDEWRKCGLRLAAFPAVSAAFPEDGPARLARAQEARETCERALAAQQEKSSRLRERREALEEDAALLDALPRLRALAERKSGFRQAQLALPRLCGEKERADADLARELERLGPDWDCERIRQTDRGIFADKDLERQARELNAADSSHQAAVDSLDRLNRDVELCRRDIASATAALEMLPQPVAALGEADRDRLRQTLVLLEEGRQRLPARERAVQQARHTFERAQERLRLAADEPRAALDALLSKREEALGLAREVQASIDSAGEAARAVQQAEEQADMLRARLEQLREEQRGSNGPSREALDNRSSALRSLRALSASLETEQERLKELSERLSAEKEPAAVKNLALLVLGGIIMLLGIGILVGHWQFGLESLAITETLHLPMTLWSGYLVLVCGAMAVGGGLPRRNGPEAKRLRQERLQLESRRETCALHVAELGDKARKLCQEAGVDSMDPETLEAVEVMLERKREQCFNQERSHKEAEELQREISLARTRIAELQTRSQEMQAVVQRIRRRWQDFMSMLRVVNVPAPESAESFFARAESARAAWDAVENAQAELEGQRADLAQYENTLRAFAPVQECLREPGDLPALLEAVRQVLESCREADAAREQRIKATATLQHHKDELERIQERQAEASEALARAQARLEAARSDWGDCLSGLGLGEDLDPETVRKALQCMDTCLSLDAGCQRLAAELAQNEQEMAALRQPLEQLLTTLARPLPRDEEGAIDWLGALDSTLEAAERAAEVDAEARRLDSLLAEQDAELRAASAALEEARHGEATLLHMAEAADADEFLRLAAILAQSRETQRLRDSLQESLRIAAGNQPFEAFLASFEAEDHDAQESRCAALNAELQDIREQEERLSDEVGSLTARVNGLTGTDTLARLRQQEALALESMRRLALQWSALALARELLLRAKDSFERERQPQVIRLASSIFASITGGNWRGINASLDDTSLHILPHHGEAISPEALSRGTQEQAYLALRLAYIQNHAERATPLPVIMDDVLVNFDPQRAARAARTFIELSEGRHGRPHQLLYFTCHPHMADMLREAQPHCAIFRVENGGIARQ
ncbi:AAA family ATPase [uncultured Desulfovibrio sp.]|uniref:AAA family ATPase n=1 Tax=uncultured Desulfovibrio sp. TaxID=167968 RepID=UPI002632A797|nr:AAA family ATPase [uncultured Desulfovibrio sp.]